MKQARLWIAIARPWIILVTILLALASLTLLRRDPEKVAREHARDADIPTQESRAKGPVPNKIDNSPILSANESEPNGKIAPVVARQPSPLNEEASHPTEVPLVPSD